MKLKTAYSQVPNQMRKYLPVLFFGVLTYLVGATNILSEELHRFVDQSLHLWWTQFEPMLGKILVACLFVSVVRLFHDPVQNRMGKAMTALGAGKRDKDIVAWVSRIAYWMLLVFGVCGILGLDIFAKVFAGVFGLGAVLAFALKDSVNDFFCGIYLRFNRHLDLGTYIEVVRADASVLGEIDIADGETDVNYKLPTGRELIGFVCKKGGGAAFAVGDWGEFCDDITTDDVLAFALVSRDSQWIHTDIERATAQFGGLVVHGALTASRVSALFGNVFPGSGTIYLESGINFKKMVIAPNKITVRATITEYTEKGTKGKMRLAVEITNQEGDIVAEGHALLLVAVTATSG